MSGLRDVKIGDTISIAGHRMKLIEIQGESIVYQLYDMKGKLLPKLTTYGLTAFRIICRNYGMNLIV